VAATTVLSHDFSLSRIQELCPKEDHGKKGTWFLRSSSGSGRPLDDFFPHYINLINLTWFCSDFLLSINKPPMIKVSLIRRTWENVWDKLSLVALPIFRDVLRMRKHLKNQKETSFKNTWLNKTAFKKNILYAHRVHLKFWPPSHNRNKDPDDVVPPHTPWSLQWMMSSNTKETAPAQESQEGFNILAHGNSTKRKGSPGLS